MSSATRQNTTRAVSAVRDLLDQLIAEVPQKQQRATPPKATQTSRPKSVELDRLFSYIENKSSK